jgi:hypothetical protein
LKHGVRRDIKGGLLSHPDAKGCTVADPRKEASPTLNRTTRQAVIAFTTAVLLAPPGVTISEGEGTGTER